MKPKSYSAFCSFIQTIAASRPGAWFFARTMHYFDSIFLALSGGRTTMTSIVAGLPTVIVTTTGAKSGRLRRLPLLCIRDAHEPTTFALIATNWGQRRYPAWYFNLKANSQASCSIDGQTGSYVAHEATGEEYERFWNYAADTYKGYPLYKQRITGRQIPIMVMTPVRA